MEQLFRDETRVSLIAIAWQFTVSDLFSWQDNADARSPKELIRDEVLRHAEPDLLNMGIKLISYTIKEST